MFTRLRIRLTVLYAGLFGVALILIAGAVYTAIRGNAIDATNSELAASGTVFDRIWSLRSQQLRDSADLLARDFGFRAAVATGDQATADSALENLRQRLGIDLAFIVGVDGKITGMDGHALADDGAGLWSTLSSDDTADGVLMIGGRPYQAISAPIMAPVLTGWVVFANELDSREMKSLEGLSAIPLTASVVSHSGKQPWTWMGESSIKPQALKALTTFVEHALAAHNRRPGEVTGPEGRSAGLVKSLPTIDKNDQAALLLIYPLTKALAPYSPLLASIALIGFLGMMLLVAGSWALARSLTRPISALDEAAHQLQQGESVHVEVTTQDEIGRLAASFNSMADAIGERERRITHLAMHDGETGLPNRFALERDLDVLLARNTGKMVIVASLGIDRFVFVRGAIGYRLSALLINIIGSRLSALPVSRSVARVSSAVLGLVYEACDVGEARAIAADLLSILEEPVELDGVRVDVSLTIGLSACGVADSIVTSPIERSAIAVDQARAAHRKTAYFDEAAYGDPSSNLSLISDLRNGVTNGDFSLHYQPKYDLRLGRVTAVEALARWRHPDRGMIPPDLFIGMAEETGHIGPLTEYVLSQAIGDQATMRAAGHDLQVSINISGRTMDDAEFSSRALSKIKAADANLCFEITETAVIDNPDLALAIIDRLVEAGVGISIDDYGSGLSSLTYLKQIRANELKIDKSFVMALSAGKRDALLVKSTIDLAHGLGLKVVAEGVETPEALAMLTAMGCDVAQGYLIARPMPLPALLDYLATASARSEGAA